MTLGNEDTLINNLSLLKNIQTIQHLLILSLQMTPGSSLSPALTIFRAQAQGR